MLGFLMLAFMAYIVYDVIQQYDNNNKPRK